MADLAQLEARMKALDQKISPIANQTVDISAIVKRKSVVASSPLEQAKVKSEAEALVEELIAAYPSSDSVKREKLRAMLAANSSFDWATGKVPRVSDATENFRRELLRLSISDQGRDARDLLVALEEKGRAAQTAGINPAPIAVEVASLSSDKDRYGMGSTRQILLNAALRWEAHSKKT